jgi:RNA-directed DNA polymerase
VLAYAYQRCKANKGAPGIDGQDFADVEAYGEERWLDELADTLRRKTYRPEAVRRVWIPKANGKLRHLGIPRLVDRVAMTAATVVLEAIFEADMPAERHGCRPNLTAHTAVKEINRLINGGHTRIVDGDLADYYAASDPSCGDRGANHAGATSTLFWALRRGEDCASRGAIGLRVPKRTGQRF